MVSSFSSTASRAAAACSRRASGDAFASVSLQLLEGVELRRLLGEVVVELGELLLLDGGDLDGDIHQLALELAPVSVELNVFSSPADMPTKDSSSPSSIVPRPTW